MHFLKKPKDYNPRHNIVICVIDCMGEILLLKRNDDKFKGGMWDLPGGKIDGDEELSDAMSREILEETGISLNPDCLKFIATTYIRYPEFDFTSNLFCCDLNKKPRVKIAPKEHSEFRWVPLNDSLSMNLVPDEKERIELYIKRQNKND